MSNRQDRKEAARLWDLLCTYDAKWRAWRDKAQAEGTSSAGPMPEIGNMSVRAIGRALAKARKRGMREGGAR